MQLSLNTEHAISLVKITTKPLFLGSLHKLQFYGSIKYANEIRGKIFV